MEQKELANFVIREVNMNIFMTKGRWRINGRIEYDWGAVRTDSECFPMTYAEAEVAMKELMNHDMYSGTFEICERSKKDVTLDMVT